METVQTKSPPLSRIFPPYDVLEPLHLSDERFSKVPEPGEGIVWQMGHGSWSAAFDVTRRRPPGVALIVILPPAVEIQASPELLRVIEACRPHSILPFHAEPHLDDLTAVLRREPDDLPAEVMDYLMWRGVNVDMETRRLIRRTVELSFELRSVTALARSMYLSRRALGRHFLSRGLPVPSHWLHFSRILRVALRLQDSSQNLLSAAYEFGYADGFALSNQMHRLTGIRPSEARRNLGWEWILEAWLRTEATTGGLSQDVTRKLMEFPGVPPLEAAAVGARPPDQVTTPQAPPPRPVRRPWSRAIKAKP